MFINLLLLNTITMDVKSINRNDQEQIVATVVLMGKEDSVVLDNEQVNFARLQFSGLVDKEVEIEEKFKENEASITRCQERIDELMKENGELEESNARVQEEMRTYNGVFDAEFFPEEVEEEDFEE